MTTERILPSVALQAPARPHLRRDVAPATTRIARPLVQKREAILTTPARAGMLIGASAAIYAVTLTGVSVLQAQADAQIVARNAPQAAALAATRAANDELEQTLLSADAQVRTLASTYALVGETVTAYQARLDELAALVADVQGSVAALPTRISLPSVTMRGAVASGGGGRAPATRATTKASGAP